MARLFQKVFMASEFNKAWVRTGEFQISGTDAPVYGGAFVLATSLANSSVYSTYTTGTKDLSKMIVSAPVTATVLQANAGVYVTDVVKVSDGTINGNVYREGAKTLILQANAGEPVSLRRLEQDDCFILGADNFVTAPTVGQYAKLTAASVDLTASSTLPATGLALMIEQSLTISEGTSATTPAYLCRVEQV